MTTVDHALLAMPSFPHHVELTPQDTCQTMSSPTPHDQLITQAEPDADTIKMFVGQIPRHYDEDDLRKMFSKYGPVYSVTVLRDKQKGQSKGCCFVTFYKRQHSLDAQNDLHNLKTMPGMSHPIQMKPADSEKRNVEERKLFVGMISKKWTENDVRALFAPFGGIEECTILRENNESKGCAFVTFANKQSAQNAIKSIHHSQTMEGCRSPVVVKIADTQKDKEMRKVQQLNNNIFSAAQMPFGALCPQYLTLLQQAIGTGNIGALGALGLNNSLGLQQLLSSASNQGNNPSLLATLLANLLSSLANQNSNSGQSSSGGATGQQGNSASVCPPGSATGVASPPPTSHDNMYSHCDPGNLQQLQGLALLASMAGGPGTYQQQTTANSVNAMNAQNLQLLNQLTGNNTSSANALSGLGSTGSPIISLSDMMTPTSSSANLTGSSLSMSNSNMGSLNGFSSGLGSNSPNPSMEALYTGLQQYAATFPGSVSAQALQQQKLLAGADNGAGKQTEGPDGANLFIYHLPQEFADHDLMQTFMPFGNVVSSKVFIDKQTKLSKCFGFVSYDNPLSAHAAIQNMNGFQIGTKRLKVQLKRPKSDAKPY